VNSIGTPEVAQFVEKIASLYSPELRVGYSSVGLHSLICEHSSERVIGLLQRPSGKYASPSYEDGNAKVSSRTFSSVALLQRRYLNALAQLLIPCTTTAVCISISFF
jgi:hypothetical protein